MAEPPDPVARINALTTNARNTWFVLLGVLVFVAITLMGVQDIDFYGVDRQTALPLVNVSVPTWLFFYAAPLLITAVYGYFHLYLIRLWDALGDADAIIDGSPLGDVITPWLVTDTALHLRARTRPDTCVTPRAMEWPNTFWNILFAWIAGLAVLVWLWWFSMPARDWVMTGLAGACLILSAAFGYASAAMMRRRMTHANRTAHSVWDDSILASLAILTATVFSLTQARTTGDIKALAPINLTGAELVEKPANWLPYDIARKDFLATWCQREHPACEPPQTPNRSLIARLIGAAPSPPQPARSVPPAAFEEEWKRRHTTALNALKKPRWSAPGEDPPDLRNAELSRTFLSGIDLGGARLQKANLDRAQMQEANLKEAQMQEADLSEAQMQGATLTEANLREANLVGAQLQGASLFKAKMQEADLFEAQMQGATLTGAQMQEAVLNWALMQGTQLSGAQMQEAEFNGAEMQRANLSLAQMQGAQLSGAQMQAAEFSFSFLSGHEGKTSILSDTNLSASTNNGGALRDVDLSDTIIDAQTDWRNVFLDGSVIVPEQMRDRIGQPCLWDWIEQNQIPLSEENFVAHWRGWLKLNPSWRDRNWKRVSFVSEDWRDIEAEDPPSGCVWHTDPLPGPETAD